MASSYYWKDMYGERGKEFIEGVIAGVTAFAVWESGVEVVGILKKPLKEEIEDIKTQLGWNSEWERRD